MEMIQQIEHPFTACHIHMECGDKTGARPACGNAPRLAQHHVIERSAEDDVVRRTCSLRCNARTGQVTFVAIDGIDRDPPKLFDIRLLAVWRIAWKD